MNRFVGFALIGGFLASSAAASDAMAGQASHGTSRNLAAPVVQEPIAPAVEPSTASTASDSPAITQRIIQASQAAARTPLAPAAAEQAPASQASPNSCPPARTEIACHRP